MDDEEGIRCVLVVLLRRRRIEVVTATNGADALQRQDREPFDFLVTDYQMPNMDGLELLAAVRREWPRLPVVVMSGSANESAFALAMAHGACAILRKPFAQDNVDEMLAAALGLQHHSG